MSTPAPMPVNAPNNQTREQLIMRYASLARRAVSHFTPPRYGAVDQEDMYSFATLGLIDAVDRFDVARGVKFETYAITRIRGFVVDQLRDMDWMPRSTRANVQLVRRTADRLEESLGRTPATDELARETGLPIKACFRALADAACHVTSLDDLTMGSEDGQDPFVARAIEDKDSPNPARFVEQHELQRGIVDALAALPLREGMVVRLRYIDDLSHREIASLLNVSESRVSQLHARGIARMRDELVNAFGDLSATQLTA